MLPSDLQTTFEAWSRRGRGYEVWPTAVRLEPRFLPFLGGQRSDQRIDDGRKPGLIELFKSPSTSPATESDGDLVEQPLAPRPPRVPSGLTELQIMLPFGFSVRTAFAKELIAHLHNLAFPVSFELIGLFEGIVVQLACSHVDEGELIQTLHAYFPEVAIKKHRDVLSSCWGGQKGSESIIDFGLSEPYAFPLEDAATLENDPLIAVIGALNDLDEDELGLVQVLFQPAREPWQVDLQSVLSVADRSGTVAPFAQRKLSSPLMAAVIRVASRSTSKVRALSIARSIGNSLISATSSPCNGLIALSNDGYADSIHAQDILLRQTHRSGMLLNERELLSLVHLPSALVRSERLVRGSTRTKAVPPSAVDHPLVLGLNEHDGVVQCATLSEAARLRHTYVVGASGSGKSTLLLNLILQDLDAGAGLAVLDPHGDLIDDVLARMPAHRAQDVCLIDPSDSDFPVGLNVLSAHSDSEKIILSSDLVGVFRRMSTSWGDQMTSVFGNAVLAFLESPEGGTLLDLRRFLVDSAFRKRFLSTVRDPEVIFFWESEFPLLKGLPQSPLLTRLDTFLRPKLIRHMVAQKVDRLDLRAMMDERKVLLARLSQGAIGEENAYLLGSLLVARINQVALTRQDQERTSRTPFYLYIDEFQHFITPSITSVLSGARKYGIGLTLAHQDLRQLRSRSEDVASAVLSNAYTRIVFRTSDSDAKALAEGFSFFEASDIQNLGIGEAIARIERQAFDFNLKVSKPKALDPSVAATSRLRVINASRQAFATPRHDVEASLYRSRRAPQDSAPAGPPRTPEPAEKQKPDTAPQPPPESGSAPTEQLRGRGGAQHKYLQSLIKRSAEDRGFRASIEQPVLDGHGHVDVLLERNGMRVACEISITTSASHEFDNLSKCLASGFDYVILLSPEKRTLAAVEKDFLPELPEEQRARLRLLQPERLIAFLDQIQAQVSATESTVRGYKVSVNYGAADSRERDSRQRLIADVISKSLRRTKS